jgi:hypothetical protein
MAVVSQEVSMQRLVAAMALCAVPALAFAQSDLEPDHLFVVVSRQAPEAVRLESAGLRLAPDPVIHEGQGTASRFFFFENAYLELIWVEDPAELKSALPELAQRVVAPGALVSPFGLGLRREGEASTDLPFPTRPYTAEWMLPETAIRIAEAQPQSEPFLFVLPHYMSYPSLLEARPATRDLMDHAAGLERVTSVRFHGPRPSQPSAATAYLLEHGVIRWTASDEHALELVFDEGRTGNTIDVRPDLPLIIRH